MPQSTTNRYPTMGHIQDAADASRYSARFFSDDNVAEWSMRLYRDDIEQDGHGGAFFITSDRPDPEQPRLYTVRHIDPAGDVRPVDGQFTLFPGRSIPTQVDALDFTRLPTLAEARSKLGIAASGSRLVATLEADGERPRV